MFSVLCVPPYLLPNSKPPLTKLNILVEPSTLSFPCGCTIVIQDLIVLHHAFVSWMDISTITTTSKQPTPFYPKLLSTTQTNAFLFDQMALHYIFHSPPFESHRICPGRARTPLLAGLIERFPPRFHKLAALRVPVDNTPFSPRSYRKRRGNSLLVINVQIATHCSCPDWQSPRPLWMWPSVTRRPATVFSVVHVVEC